MNSNKKIIYLISTVPNYSLYPENYRPEINWATKDGNWLGIWGNDWGDQLGTAILQATDEFEFEVWQPDYRADRIYEYKFENGLVHKLFPAKKTLLNGSYIAYSYEIFKSLEIYSGNYNVILHISIDKTSQSLITKYKGRNSIHILGSFHGTITLPIQRFFKIKRNPLNYLKIIKEHIQFKRSISYYDFITYQSDANIDKFRKIYNGPLDQITMGVDFEKFKSLNKISCRSELNLPLNRTVLLSVGHLIPRKQTDKLIQVTSQLAANHKFILIIIGNSENDNYFRYLKKAADPLIKSGYIIFTGYKAGPELVKYYNASDLFLMTSRSEAGPVTTMEAIACGTPVMSTDTGRVSELLQQYKKGIILKSTDYNQWLRELDHFVRGGNVDTLDRKTAYRYFSWSGVSSKFIQIYEKLS